MEQNRGKKQVVAGNMACWHRSSPPWRPSGVAGLFAVCAQLDR